jgi:hypothetical protein
MHPALKKGTKNFHYTSKTCGIFCDLIFYEIKIPMVNMKVLGYSNFSKKKIWKKNKSPSSMRNENFHLPKHRGMLQKMGVLYTHSPKRPGPFSKLSKKNSKEKKKGTGFDRGTTSGRPPAAGQSCPCQTLCLFIFIFIFLCPLLFVQVVNSCWLATTHARPA